MMAPESQVSSASLLHHSYWVTFIPLALKIAFVPLGIVSVLYAEKMGKEPIVKNYNFTLCPFEFYILYFPLLHPLDTLESLVKTVMWPL